MNTHIPLPAAASPAQEDASTRRHYDPLSDALLYLAAHHGRALTRQSLLQGLPIEQDRLSVALFSRAAVRAGLEAAPARRSLRDIPGLVCPVPLVMKDRSVLILLQIEHESGTAEVAHPGEGGARAQVPIAELERGFSEYFFLVRPTGIDARTQAAGDLDQPHWFWSVVTRYWENYSQVALSAVIVNMLGLASPLFFMNVYDRVIPNGAMASLIALAIGMFIMLIFDFVLRMVRSRIIDTTGKKIDVVLAAEIFEHVMALRMAQKPQSVGILANQLRDFDSVREFFTSGTVVAATDLLFAVLFVAVLFLIAGPLAFIPLLMLPLMILLGYLIQRPLEKAMRKLQSEASARHSVLVESLAGLETLRATGAEARMQTLWERSVASAARSSEGVNFWASLAMTASNSAQQLTSVLLIIIGVGLILNGQITVGALVGANMLSGRVLAPIASIASLITRGTQTLTSLRAIDKLMALPRERPPGRSYVARRIEHGGIRFEKVTFRYPNTTTDALTQVDFRIAPGERVGIIGRIGSGKTTIGRLLDGFYEPMEGRILIDDVDLRQYDPADLRAGVGFVLQDTELFFGTVRDNIALGKPAASDEEILLAARLAGVERFIASHPLGYEMPVSEGGRSLSGGQKQAIGLARVLIRQPKILFLDEPTAHFDVRSEAEFLARLRELTELGMTLVVSTHRLSVLSIVERLMVFDQGRMTANGPRDAVMAAIRGEGPVPG